MNAPATNPVDVAPLLRPSNAHQWMNCPGSAHAQAGFPDKESDYMAEGTAAHALAAHCLEQDLAPERQIGKVFHRHQVDADMAREVAKYVDYINELPGKLFVEHELELSAYLPERDGTADAVLVDDGLARVIDLKYGRGVRVDAENNEQLRLYALGVLDSFDYLYDIDTVEMTIVMPRLDHISSVSMSVRDLQAWGETAVKCAEAAQTPNAERVPGKKQCQFCKAKATCRALAKDSLYKVQQQFDDLTDPVKPVPVETLTISEMAHLLGEVSLISGWVKALEAYATQLALTGTEVPGYKLVAGRAARKWTDEEEVETILKRKRYKVDDITPRSLLSVAQMEKFIGKKKFTEVLPAQVKKAPGKPTLVPEADKRQALDPSALDGFEDMTKDQTGVTEK